MNRRIGTVSLPRLAALAQEDSLKIYAWFLPPNHFHLLRKTRKTSLSSSMHNPPFASLSQKANPALMLISIRHAPLVPVYGTSHSPL